MPRIELIDIPLFNPNDPYHFEYDNLPLKSIIRRENLINMALDNVIQQTRDAIGTQGSLSNRLNQSIDPDGNLKSEAIDEALHSIEEHTDTDDYVRMTKDESDKLALISDNATDIVIDVETDDDTISFDGGIVNFVPSDTVTWEVESPNKVKANITFPTEAAHTHYYGLEPVHDDSLDPDYINYKVNSSSSAFIEGSLRIYINGARLDSSTEIYIPGALVEDPWTLLKFTPDHDSGTFELSTAITEEDVIRIDFDLSFI